MAYAAWSVVAGEQPTASKWNILGTNDASFNDGTGIGSATITPSKLATGATTNSVAAAETTTGTSYTDLATSGPAVTVTIGANGLALVTLLCSISNSAANTGWMGFAVSGATTLAAADARAIAVTGTSAHRPGGAVLVTGLTAGSNTFTSKYRVTGGTGTFGADRVISVTPL